jgi:hypothetical protein
MEMGFSERVAKKALEMSNYNLEAAFEMCIGRAVIRWTRECEVSFLLPWLSALFRLRLCLSNEWYCLLWCPQVVW